MHTIANIRSLVVVTGTLALFAACGSDAAPAADPSPREIQLAPTTNAPAQLNDAPATPAAARVPATTRKRATPTSTAAAPQPSAPPPPAPTVVVTPITPAPAPSTAPAATRTGTVAEGVTLTVRPSGRICTNTSRIGDRVAAVLVEPVQGSNGLTIPAGAEVTLGVTQSARGENSKDAKLAFDAMSIRVGDGSYEVGGRVLLAQPLDKVRAQSTGDQAKKVGAGAVIGAIAGQVIGRNTRSTVVGTAVGAAAGAAVASGTADYDGCVPTTGTMTFTLTRPLVAKLVAANPE